jgi:hypothetical protein
MRKYRIKQISENLFIPQVKKGFFGCWCSIDENYNSGHYLYEEIYCACISDTEAADIIYNHDYKSKKTKKYPIYHKFPIFIK